MKKWLGMGILLMSMMAAGFTTFASTDETEVISETEMTSNILVAYFSATGNTEDIAETLVEMIPADTYVITPAEPYTDEDLNYNDSGSRATVEQGDKSLRPEINGTVASWEQYDVIFLGYPIWWGEEPRIMDTFAESYDFAGKTVIPFCTSGSSGIGNSAANLESLTEGGTWLDGERFARNTSSDELADWVSGLELDIEAE